MSNCLRIEDYSAEEVATILAAAEQPTPPKCLDGRGAALIFEFPSDRTRNASEMAIVDLGGHPVSITAGEVGFDVRETVEDVARTLACYHALIGARVAKHSTLDRMVSALSASPSPVPVINLLSNEEHPTQALADLLTIRQEFGSIAGHKVAYVGDANNVCRSLAWGCAAMGASVAVASPPGFGLTDAEIERLRARGAAIEITSSPQEAADGADVLYTDVWVSMGEEGADEKRKAFVGFTIDESLIARASDDVIVLHCLPAHRGEEISPGAIEGPHSRVWRQAENRRHAMRGLVQHVLGGGR